MQIYSPEEDSYLLSEVIKKKQNLQGKKILDMGSGSGIQTETAISQGANPKNITLVDINPDSIRLLKKKFPNSQVIQSDLFAKIKDEKFDYIFFNPPYLPQDKDNLEPKDSQRATTGGKHGSEVINRFLTQAKSHLNTEGKILILISNLTKKIDWKNYKKEKLMEKKLFFEVLEVWELRSIN